MSTNQVPLLLTANVSYCTLPFILFICGCLAVPVLLNLKDPSAGTAISAAAAAPAAGMAVSNAAGTAATAGAARAPPRGMDCTVVTVKTKLPTVRQVWRWRDPGRDKLANVLFTIALQQGPHLTPADQGGKSIKGWEKFTTTVTNPGDGCLRHYDLGKSNPYHNVRKLVLGLAKEYSVSYRDDTTDGNATSSVQKQGNRIHMDAEQAIAAKQAAKDQKEGLGIVPASYTNVSRESKSIGSREF